MATACLSGRLEVPGADQLAGAGYIMVLRSRSCLLSGQDIYVVGGFAQLSKGDVLFSLRTKGYYVGRETPEADVPISCGSNCISKYYTI
jgi:hypothetical protein